MYKFYCYSIYKDIEKNLKILYNNGHLNKLFYIYKSLEYYR